MSEEQKRTAAYLPWATFTNSLEQLSKGMPSRIDRSVFAGTAWNVQTQLFIALRFFGFLKAEGDAPTPVLEDVVTGTPEERKSKLIKVLRESYAELIAIDLPKATKNHFEESIGSLYNVSGDTKVKAIRFFLNAAEYAGISLSSFIAPKDGKAVSRRPRSSNPRVKAQKPHKESHGVAPMSPTPPVHEPKPSGTSKTVSLASGGTLTLSATLDLFALNQKDREFVFEFIDKMEAYAKS